MFIIIVGPLVEVRRLDNDGCEVQPARGADKNFLLGD
jgi:hypothetical protein